VLFTVIKIGLKETATVFQPKRYGNDYFGEKSLVETNLWLRTLWAAGLRAPEVEAAFLRHRAEGRAFPRPADIIKLTEGN
jgi:hypothetical protein